MARNVTSPTSLPEPPRVAVVGGGFAGLAAAYRLARTGVKVSLFERSGHLGGLAMTVPIADTEVEKYYHHWFTSDRDILALIDELGLAGLLRWRSPVMGMFCRGAVWRFMSPFDLLAFRPFSMAAKLRFGLVTLFLQRYPRREPFERWTADEWLRRYAGREVYETIWGPLLRAKFGRNAERISMAWIWSKMRLRGTSRTRGGTRESLGTIEGGFGVVTRALAAAIRSNGGEVHTAERVVRIVVREDAQAGDPLEVETPRRCMRFSAVISTVAPPLLARLAPGLPEEYRRRCEGIEHAAILCSLLVLRRRMSEIYWMNVSDPDIPFGGLIEHTNFVPPDAYGGRHLVYVSHYVHPDDPIYGMDAAGIFRAYLPALRKIVPGFSEDWIERRMELRDRWAQPIVTLDYPKRIVPLATPIDGLFAATMSQIYPEDRGTNYAVRIGNAAADSVVERLTRREHLSGRNPPGVPLASVGGS